MATDGSNSPSFSNSSSDHTEKVKKTRVRQSLVCHHCKRRKIKCDKKRPTCGNCAKLHIECIYDLENQSKHKNGISKPSTLHEKLNELESKFEDLQRTLKVGDLEDWNQASSPSKVPTKVNFYEGLQPCCLTSIFKSDYKPFSDMGMIQRNPRLNPFLKFVTRSFKPLNYAVKKLMLSVGDIITPHSDELESVAKVLFLTPEVRKILKKHTMNPEDLNAETSEAIKRCLLEKGTQTSQNALTEPIDLEFYVSKTTRQELIDLIVSILPNKTNLDQLLTYFMTKMYPLVPYIHKTQILEMVADSLQYSHSGQVIGLKIGDDQDFARKIGRFAIFLVLLRISYTAMMLVNKPYDGEVTNQFISVAQKCLAHLIALSHNTNEDILSCLILIRWSLLYFPTDGDVMTGSITDMLMSLIMNHAFKIGLYRDCIHSELDRSNDPEGRYFFHYRTKLWMGTLILLRSDMYLRGNFPTLSAEYANMTLKQEVRENYEDETEYQVHRILHKQLEVYSKASVLDKLSSQLREGTDVDEIYSKIRHLEYELQYVVPLSNTRYLAPETSIHTVLQSMNNALHFKVNVIIRIYFLAIRASIVCDLEAQIIKRLGRSEHLPLRYREVTMECFEAALHLGGMLQDYMSSASDEQNKLVFRDHRYFMDQLVQIGTFRVSYYLIGVILTILRVKEGLSDFKWQNENKQSLGAEINYKTSVIDSVAISIFQYVQKLVHLGSHTLSDTYFTSFKQLFLEYAMQVIQNEINPNTTSHLKEVLGDTYIPAAIDYSPEDWVKFSNYVHKALGQGPSVPSYPSADELLAATAFPIGQDDLTDELMNPMSLFGDDVNIQNMLDGDYTWADFI
ncbi:LAME_0B02014g1_1 [Lachancea meyersii CBS 8951]|uniref:LAME_0B02014g1_1 n=1 Tax=Lachancea meyersii CBS 8951 TaxID=1266667 RepID=A0A1G4IU31_9SACH|nr:LAME_0B02014g1_1 [Lachancea meyersii CBS 8951]